MNIGQKVNDKTEQSGVFAVIGPPGCGKTTWLSNKVSQIVNENRTPFGDLHKKPVLICSLTRTAAAEVAQKATSIGLDIRPDSIGTLHSHAYRALGCPPLLAGDLLVQWNKEQPGYRLCDNQIDPDDPGWERNGRSSGAGALEEYDLLRQRMVPKDQWPAYVRNFGQCYETFKAENECIDFTDMIAQVVEQEATATDDPQHLFIDEAQDSSQLELTLLRQWAKQAQSLHIVGDPWQSLYTWRGAHPEMFTSDKIAIDHRQVLSQSYRVSKAVHKAATTWIRRLTNYSPIEYQPTDVDGSIELLPAHFRQAEAIISHARNYLDEGKSIMIQASCSHLLGPLLAVVRELGLPFSNPWRTKRGDWNPLAPRKGKTIPDRLAVFLGPLTGQSIWTYDNLPHWLGLLKSQGLLKYGAKAAITQAAAQRQDEPIAFDDLSQWFDMFELSALWKIFFEQGPGSIEALQEAVKWFSDHLLAAKIDAAQFPLSVARSHGAAALSKEPKLHIGTVHSFKGAEADVTIIIPDLSMAGYRELHDNPDAITRMFYVALTRAREKAVVCYPQSVRHAPLQEVAA